MKQVSSNGGLLGTLPIRREYLAHVTGITFQEQGSRNNQSGADTVTQQSRTLQK